MIPITSVDILRKLAALAVGQEPSSGPEGTPAPSAGAAPVRDQGASDSTLGPLDIGRYLSAYGIEWKLKPNVKIGNDIVDLYTLRQCLFDSNHRNGQSAIGLGRYGLFYQCYHTSCASHDWKEARALISGDKSLAEWMAGYDPDWKRKKKKEKKAAEKGLVPSRSPAPAAQASGILPVTENRYARVDNIINNWEVVIMSDGIISPSPLEIEPMLFFERKGERTEFVPRRAANYLHERLAPLAFSLGEFWKYTGGVWKVFPMEEIVSILTHALKDHVKGKMVDGVIGILKGLIYVPEEMWEPNPYLINIKNGMLDIHTMELSPHSPDYRSRVQLPVSYQPGAPVGRWYEFLKSVFPEDHEKDEKGQYTNYMEKHVVAQQFAGYCLLRDCRYQRGLFLYGTGANGKSTFINVIGSVLGKENTASLSLSSLKEAFMTINLHNKLANLASETNPKAVMESEIFNSCVTGDELSARKIYTQSLKFRPFCKFIISMNEAPQVPDKSYAFQRRILVLNFSHRFTPEEINPQMSELLIEEKDGVFSWMIDGLKRLLTKNGFVVGGTVQDDIDQMMTRVNPFISFVEDCCVVEAALEVRTQEMWDAYRDWCQEGGNRPLGRNKFLDQALSHFPKVKKKKGTGENEDKIVFVGIGLNDSAVEEMRSRLAKRRQEKWDKKD